MRNLCERYCGSLAFTFSLCKSSNLVLSFRKQTQVPINEKKHCVLSMETTHVGESPRGTPPEPNASRAASTTGTMSEAPGGDSDSTAGGGWTYGTHVPPSSAAQPPHQYRSHRGKRRPPPAGGGGGGSYTPQSYGAPPMQYSPLPPHPGDPHMQPQGPGVMMAQYRQPGPPPLPQGGYPPQYGNPAEQGWTPEMAAAGFAGMHVQVQPQQQQAPMYRQPVASVAGYPPVHNVISQVSQVRAQEAS